MRNSERIIKGIQTFIEEENKIIKKLNYISKINKNQKEIDIIFQQLMKNLNISFNDNNIKYEEYYFNGIPTPKDIEFSDIKANSFKISWKIDDINIIDVDNKKIKYIIEIRKENGEFKLVYEGVENNYLINNLDSDTIYEIRIYTLYNNIKTIIQIYIKLKLAQLIV